MSDDSDTGRLSAYTGGPCLTVDRQARSSMRLEVERNMLVECGSVPAAILDLNDLPKPMAKITNLGDVNITFKPATALKARNAASLETFQDLLLLAETYFDYGRQCNPKS